MRRQRLLFRPPSFPGRKPFGGREKTPLFSKRERGWPPPFLGGGKKPRVKKTPAWWKRFKKKGCPQKRFNGQQKRSPENNLVWFSQREGVKTGKPRNGKIFRKTGIKIPLASGALPNQNQHRLEGKRRKLEPPKPNSRKKGNLLNNSQSFKPNAKQSPFKFPMKAPSLEPRKKINP